VTSRKRIIFSFLKELGQWIGDLIEDQGWSFFCSLNVPTYPNLVRSFYENLRLEEQHVESTVKGKRIIVTAERLCSLLKMPNEGLKHLILKDKKKTFRTILNRENVSGIGNVMANTLSLEMRLLHNFFSRIFLSRIGRFDWVTERDLSFMGHVIDGEALNLPHIMLLQMKEAVRKVKAYLPYGMVLTLFFQASRVNLNGEDGRPLHHTDTYSSKSLQRMGYQLTEGAWRKKGSDLRAIGSSSSDEDDDDE